MRAQRRINISMKSGPKTPVYENGHNRSRRPAAYLALENGHGRGQTENHLPGKKP